MTYTTQPRRIPVPCGTCGAQVAFVASAQVARAQAFSPWRGWALAVVVSSAARMLALQCHVCEAQDAPRPAARPAPTFL